MFIVFGTKKVEKKQGWVADYCPICDEPNVFRLFEVRSVGHLYYIPLGRGTVEGHVRQCRQCKNKVATDASNYQSISQNKRASLEDLTDETHPGLIEGMAGYLDLRDRAVSGEASEYDRRELLRHPFTSIIYPVAARKANIQIDGRTLMWFLSIFFVPILVAAVMDAMPRPFNTDAWVLSGVLITVAIMSVCLIVSIATEAQRFTRKKFTKMIVKRLAPLDPSLEELEEILAELKAVTETRVIGKAFKPEKLHAKIMTARDNATVDF